MLTDPNHQRYGRLMAAIRFSNVPKRKFRSDSDYRRSPSLTSPAAAPVLSLDDVIGTKVRDLIDVHAATRHRSTADLENLGRRHARFEFSLHDLRDRLAGAEW